MSNQLEPGVLWLSVNYVGGLDDHVGRLCIDRADPGVWASVELLVKIAEGCGHPDTSISLGDRRDALRDGLLTIRASNRTVVYRIGEYDPQHLRYLCHWPD